jgi:hypothetical protein
MMDLKINWELCTEKEILNAPMDKPSFEKWLTGMQTPQSTLAFYKDIQQWHCAMCHTWLYSRSSAREHRCPLPPLAIVWEGMKQSWHGMENRFYLRPVARRLLGGDMISMDDEMIDGWFAWQATNQQKIQCFLLAMRRAWVKGQTK